MACYGAAGMAFFSQDRTVLFQEVDAAGIVFFARFFDWFHDAYAAALASRGIRFEKVFAEKTWGLPLVHAEADYQSPLVYAAPFRVDIDGVAIGESSITVTYAIRSGDKLHATGKTVHVAIDRKTFRAIPVPAELRAALSS